MVLESVKFDEDMDQNFDVYRDSLHSDFGGTKGDGICGEKRIEFPNNQPVFLSYEYNYNATTDTT